MSERVIRKLTAADLPAYLEIYLNAYPVGKDLSAACCEKHSQKQKQVMEEFSGVHYFGLFEAGRLAATMKVLDFQVNLFGQLRSAVGLMALGVHPLYKKRGLGREMVAYFEQYAREQGVALAMLLPFRMDYYRALGYGCGGRMEEYCIPTSQLPDCRVRGHLRYLGTGALEEVLQCHRRFVERNHGAVVKLAEEVRDMAADSQVRRIGYYAEDELRGYVAYTVENTVPGNYTCNCIDVKELVYDSGAVLRDLLGGLALQSDQAQSVVVRTGESDFCHLLKSPQDVSDNYRDFGFLQTSTASVGTMYKIVDIPGFIAATEHRVFPAVDMAVGFTVECQGEMQSFTLRFAGGRWRYEAAGTADVQLSGYLGDVSALLMGSAELGGLLRLGVMRCDKPELTDTLDALFHAAQKPFTNTDY